MINIFKTENQANCEGHACTPSFFFKQSRFIYKRCSNISNLIALYIVSGFLVIFSSCKKLVDIPAPTNSIAENSVYTTDATAISVLTGIYKSMNNAPIQWYNNSISILTGFSSDEFKPTTRASQSELRYYKNTLVQDPSQQFGSDFWGPFYNLIFKCNAAIEGLNNSSSLTPSVKQQLLGEAKFMRAFFYFYLVNCFGDVPLALTTDPQVNTILSRSSRAKIYEQIVADLLEAKQNLSNNYLDETLLNSINERVRPTKWAATALLARVYLYTSDWAKTEAEATAVINNSSLYNLLASLNEVFRKNSREAILQIQPTDQGYNTQEGYAFVIPSTGPKFYNHVYLSDQLLNSFELGDQRAINGNWINAVTAGGITYQYPYKYKIGTSTGVNSINGLTEYFMVLRLAEQYLIRAEARAKQNNLSGAQSDLNAIRNRAGLGNTAASDQSSLLTAILNERQHEFFSEWGHRWFDLKRTGKIDEVMTIVTPQKSGGATQWQSYQQLYPLPYTELQKAPNLKQNSGY